MLLAANAPDIDIVTAAWGSLSYLNYHRHLTHALLMIPVMATIPLLLVRFAGRQRFHWGSALVVSMIGVASHLALDLTNFYGVRLLLPFSPRWFRLDTTSVIDPWILAALMIAVAAPALSRLVGSEIGDKSRPGRAAGVVALVLLSGYDFGRYVLHRRAVTMLESRIYNGTLPKHVAAFPTTFNPTHWRGMVETASSYIVYDVDVRTDFDPEQGQELYPSDRKDAIQVARDLPAFRDFLQFSQYPFWSVGATPEPEGGLLVELYDLRFGRPPHPGFKVSAVLDPQMRVVRTWFEMLR